MEGYLMKFMNCWLLASCFIVSLGGCKENQVDQTSSAVQQAAPAAATINLGDLPPDPNRSFVNLVSVNIKPELLNDFLSDLNAYAALTRKEEGVLRYDIHQSPHDPSVIELYESYKNTAARLAHNNASHRMEFFGKVKDKGYFRVPAVSKVVYLIDPAN
jgi:(4S)-4-hydroxy-5-phosphonooxypentane-2,3-dione isomerase